MSRLPFQMPSGCPPISVDLEFVQPLEPEYPDQEPTGAIRLPRIITPIVLPPDMCVCLDVNITGVVNVVGNSSGKVNAAWAKVNQKDCCDPEYNLDIAVDVPCMPLSVSASANISLKNKLDVKLSFEKVDPCDLKLNLDIDIPCLPSNISVFPNYGVGDEANLLFNIQRAPGDDCAFDVSFQLTLPCLPYQINPYAIINRGDIQLQFNRHPGEDCYYDCNLNIDIPCLPDDINIFVNFNYDNVPARCNIEKIPPDESYCMYDFIMDLDIPCVPNLRVGNNIIIRGQHVNGYMWLNLINQDCVLGITGEGYLYIDVPGLSISIPSIKPAPTGPTGPSGITGPTGPTGQCSCDPVSCIMFDVSSTFSARNMKLSGMLLAHSCALQLELYGSVPCLPAIANNDQYHYFNGNYPDLGGIKAYLISKGSCMLDVMLQVELNVERLKEIVRSGVSGPSSGSGFTGPTGPTGPACCLELAFSGELEGGMMWVPNRFVYNSATDCWVLVYRPQCIPL